METGACFRDPIVSGSREPAEVRVAVLDGIGTENLLDILPEVVPEEDNFFAIPIIQSWRKPSSKRTGKFGSLYPAEALLPDGFQSPLILRETGDHNLDLAGWVEKADGLRSIYTCRANSRIGLARRTW